MEPDHAHSLRNLPRTRISSAFCLLPTAPMLHNATLFRFLDGFLTSKSPNSLSVKAPLRLSPVREVSFVAKSRGITEFGYRSAQMDTDGRRGTHAKGATEVWSHCLSLGSAIL